MPYFLLSAKAPVALLAATANQAALSIPWPKLSAIEATVPEAKQLHDALYRPKWLICSVSTWKVSEPNPLT